MRPAPSYPYNARPKKPRGRFMLIALGLIVFAIVGVLLAYRLSRQAAPREAAAPAQIAAPAAETDASVHSRLQALQQGLTSAMDDSAHPRDMRDRAGFKAVVAVFTDARTPLSTVLDYAVGANTAAATAAFAALCEREDREQASATLQSQFRHLYPWPMYY